MEHEQIKALGIPERAKNLVDTILLEIQVNGIDSGTHEWCVSMVERTLRAAAPVSVAAGLLMAARVAENAAKAPARRHLLGRLKRVTPIVAKAQALSAIRIASAIRALADQHKPSPATDAESTRWQVTDALHSQIAEKDAEIDRLRVYLAEEGATIARLKDAMAYVGPSPAEEPMP